MDMNRYILNIIKAYTLLFQFKNTVMFVCFTELEIHLCMPFH